MPRLTGPQMEQLRDAILDAFDRDALEELLQFRLDKRLDQIVSPQANLRDATRDIVTTADREGWVADLLMAVAAERPDLVNLQELVATFLAQITQIESNAFVEGEEKPQLAGAKPGRRGFSRSWGVLLGLTVLAFSTVILFTLRPWEIASERPQPSAEASTATSVSVSLSVTPPPAPSSTVTVQGTATPAPTPRRTELPVLSADGDTLDITSPIMMTLVRVPDVTTFYIGKFEVTNAQFAAFVHETGREVSDYWSNGQIPVGREEHPVVGITRADAEAFVGWLANETGLEIDLPTEAQWEKACSAEEGGLYPWGNESDTRKANYAESLGDTTWVGAYSPQGDSIFGAADMVGNAGELTRSMARGGSFSDLDSSCVSRRPPNEYAWELGFRVMAAHVPQSPEQSPTRPVVTASPPGVTSTPETAGSAEFLTITEPIPMTLVRVPAGPFLMGSDKVADPDANEDELPQHTVGVAEFYIGKYEVTNAQYAAFVQATGHSLPGDWENGRIPAGKENYPVVNVVWDDAVAFAEWLSAETGRSFRLPTEAEWEKACRGEDGRIYPWEGLLGAQRVNYGNDVGSTTQVGIYSPAGDSLYGAADMSGNVSEWMSNLYGNYPYDAGDGRENPKLRDLRVLRGGSYFDTASNVRCASRVADLVGVSIDYIGFRVVASP